MTNAKIDPSLPHFHVRKFLANPEPGPEFDQGFAELVGLPAGPQYSTDLNAVVSAISERPFWWHLSHLQATVTPTVPAKGLENVLHNSAAYDQDGRPVSYDSIVDDDGHALALCRAWVKAAYDLPDAFYVRASGVEEANKSIWNRLGKVR